MKKVLLLVFLVTRTTLFAQDWKSFSALKGESEVEVVFDYSSMKLQKDMFTEEEYVTNKVAKMNEKLEDSGTLWESSWKRSKEEIWQPKFLLLLNKHTKGKVKFRNKNIDSKYILQVKVRWIYAGWDAGIMRQPAKVNTYVLLYERSNPSNVIFSQIFKDMPGDQFGSNFNDETRIGEGFAKTGKTLGKGIVKFL